MIYFNFGEGIRVFYEELPEYGYINSPLGIDSASLSLRLKANKIFEFENCDTHYYKDRDGTYYQYSDEEKVVIRLKSVLL